MREEVMESTEEDFVRSLSHCVNWQAQGGKSGAVFYATEGETLKFKMSTSWLRLVYAFNLVLDSYKKIEMLLQ